MSGCIQEDDGTLIGGTCVSDISLKENITEDYGNLEKMKSLKVKLYNWTNSKIKIGGKEIEVCNATLNATCNNQTIELWKDLDVKGRGFIAEDVKIVYPERVREINNLSYVSYGFDWVFDLWIANQKLMEENDLIKSELCKKDNSYSWCK